MGYPSKSIPYRWYKRRKTGLENRHDHTADVSENAEHRCNTPEHPRHPSAEFKYEVLRRCFKLGEDVEYVSREIGYSRMSIYVWRWDGGFDGKEEKPTKRTITPELT